jgi:outer membrane protein TolC
VGLSTALDVLEAQEAYAQGLAGRNRALIDYALARIELNRVQGVITAE